MSILVNNAGGVFSSPLLETTENGWDALYRANLKHVILCTQRVARVMVEHEIGGSIISVTSIEGVRAAPGYAAYAAAKAGVINYTKTAALELAPHGIRVNALAPDITMTEGLAASGATGHRRPLRPDGADGTGAAMSTRWPARPSSWPATSRATSPARPSMSTVGRRRRSGWYHHAETGDYVLGPSSFAESELSRLRPARRGLTCRRRWRSSAR